MSVKNPIDTHAVSDKAIVIGLDGATFDLLLPWIEEGILPVLAEILKKGVWGKLESTIPPLTPPAWTSFITGKNPGKHGIFNFYLPLDNNLNRPLIDSRSVKSATIWEIMNTQRKRVGIINLPITYPPLEVDGFMISGLLTPRNKEVSFTYPTDLKERLISKIGDYVIDVYPAIFNLEKASGVKRFFSDLRYASIKRKDALLFLMEDQLWDFLAINFTEPDRIQHPFWKYLDKRCQLYSLDRAKYIRDLAMELYKMLDEMIGLVIKRMDKKTTLFIMSDHGFGPYDFSWSVNGWLSNLGLYKKIEGSKLRALVKAMIPDELRRKILSMMTKRAPSFEQKWGQNIDCMNSKAYFAGEAVQGIYLTVRGDEYMEFRKTLKEELLKLKDPVTGTQIVDEVFYKEEIYWGDYLPSAPDLLFIAKDYSVVGTDSTEGRKLITSCQMNPKGFHRREGIFAILGESFKRNCYLSGALIIDLLPTILYTIGLSIPDDLDGKVLKEAFVDGYPEKNPEKYIPAAEFTVKKEKDRVFSLEDEEDIKSRLRGLGYLE